MGKKKFFKSNPLEILHNVDFSPHFDRKGNFVVPVKGIIYSDENKPDLEGDWFHKGTDFGPLEKVLSYFDHQMSDWYIPREIDGIAIKGFGGKRIGHAEKQLDDEEKQIWNIIVDRRHHYLNLVEELVMEKMLDVSSLALHREPYTPGRVDVWEMAALDFTPTPAEPDAVSIVKSFILKEGLMPKKKSSKLLSNIEDAFQKGLDEENPDIEDELEEEEEVEEEGDVEEEEQINEEDVEGSDADDTVKALINGVLQRLDSIEENVQKAVDMAQDTQDALPEMANMIGKSVATDLRKIARKSKDEFQAEDDEINRRKKKLNGKYYGKMNPAAPGGK